MGCNSSKGSEAEQSKAPEPKKMKEESGEERPEVFADVQKEFTVKLAKGFDNPTLGITLIHPDDKKTLVVKLLKEEGAAVVWNEQHEDQPELQILEGDIVLEVN